MTRREGQLVEWFPDRGYGFIAPDDGGPNVFLHIKSLPKEDKRLDIGQAYTFDVVTDARGRVQAQNWWIVYGVASMGSVIGYWIDKNAAIQKSWRISETVLLLLGLVGGWPGAILAQELFRHKTRKGTFRYLFWMTVAINMAAFVQINVLGGL